MTAAQLKVLLNEARRIQRTANMAERKKRHTSWRRKVRATLKGMEHPPQLTLQLDTISEDMTIISGVVSAEQRNQAEPNVTSTVSRHEVFVVHGRNDRVRDAMFHFLRSLGLHPLEWNEVLRKVPEGSPYVGQALERALAAAGAVVVVLSPDDEARLRPDLIRGDDPRHERELTPQARPNVIFEAGMAFGRHPEKTVLVEVGGEMRPFSDVLGRYTVRMDGSEKKRRELMELLNNVGCPLAINDDRWLQAGDFGGG
jgi:predicted nucleotide-binding protein